MNLEGKRLGKYEIQAELGRGGMGVVYRAHDPTLNRTVAVKVLPPHMTWDKQFVERFLREARAAAGLDHPNIVTIHDVGEDGGSYYFVMSYVEGRPLSSLLQKRGKFPADVTLDILRQVADALDYAHQRGLVHRDVKPANVMIDKHGRATLTDFGLVRAAQDTGLTVAGTVMGTPQYMSPEQASGQSQVGPASDLYSLAVMTYEMLAGDPPFDAGSSAAILHKQVYEPPPAVTSRRPDLPDTVGEVFERALAKEPRARYPSGASFVAALMAALGGNISEKATLPPTRSPKAVQGQPAGALPRQNKGRPWGWMIASVGALVLIGALALVVVAGNADQDVTPVPTLVAVIEGKETAEPATTALRATEPPSTPMPTAEPTTTARPSPVATLATLPTAQPTNTATPVPTLVPTASPTNTATPVPTLTPTASPTIDVQNILFQDAFSNNKNDWMVGEYSSEWSNGEHTIIDGKYSIEMVSNQDAARWAYVPELYTKNLALTFDVTLVSATGDFSSGAPAVIVHLRHNTNDEYYRVFFDDDAYKILVRQDDDYKTVVDWTKNPAIKLEQGVENTFSIVIKMRTITLYANGKELAAINDGTVRTKGQIGIGGSLFEANQRATFEFDNLVITTAP